MSLIKSLYLWVQITPMIYNIVKNYEFTSETTSLIDLDGIFH